VLKNQAQYARADDKALMCAWNCITKNWHSLLGKQLKKLQRPQKELPVPAHHNEAWTWLIPLPGVQVKFRERNWSSPPPQTSFKDGTLITVAI
jgi:hypothetical protein